MRKTLLTLGAAGLMAAAPFALAGNNSQSSQQQEKQQQQQQRQSANQDQSGSQSARQSAQSSQQQQCPAGYVMLEENTVYLMANEPQQHLLQAHTDLASGNLRKAGEEIQLAAAYFDMQAARDHNQNSAKQQLTQQASQLRKLAKQIESSAKKQGNSSASSQNGQPHIQQIDQKFARATDALARHFNSLTKQDLQKKNSLAAGYDLAAAANCFKDTIIWSGQQPQQKDAAMIVNAKQIAAHLRSNDIYRAEHASKSSQQQQPGVSNSPLTGTTRAEAKNDTQHAQKMVSAIASALGQWDQKLSNQPQQAGYQQKANQQDQQGNQQQKANQRQQQEKQQQGQQGQ